MGKEGVGRGGWVDRKKKSEEGKEDGRKKQHRTCSWEREDEQSRLLARGWSDEALFVQGKSSCDPSAGPQMLPWDAPGGRSGSRGPRATPKWTAAGDAVPRNLSHPSGCWCPLPPTQCSVNPQETHGNWQLCVYSRSSINAAWT